MTEPQGMTFSDFSVFECEEPLSKGRLCNRLFGHRGEHRYDIPEAVTDERESWLAPSAPIPRDQEGAHSAASVGHRFLTDQVRGDDADAPSVLIGGEGSETNSSDSEHGSSPSIQGAP